MRWMKALTMGALLVMVGASATACDKVPAPTSDSTVPILHWTVRNLKLSTTEEFIGSKTIKVVQGDEFSVTLKAVDFEGIHEISWARSTTSMCVNGDVASQSGPGLAVPETQTLNPDADGNVVTSMFLIKSVIIGPFTCQAGYTLTSAETAIAGQGTNYFSGVATATLSFKVV